jgi:hypothetical protein
MWTLGVEVSSASVIPRGGAMVDGSGSCSGDRSGSHG